MKVDKKLVTVGGVGALLCIAMISLLLSPSGPAVPDNIISGDVGVQTISANPAGVDFAPGTTGVGNIAGGTLTFAIGANATYKVANATLNVQNGTVILYTLNISSQNFGNTYSITAPQIWGTLYVNFTAVNNSATFRSSTNTYVMNPVFGDASKVDYGSFVTVSGGLLNDTMATIQLYYPALYIKGVTYNATYEKYTVILSKKV